MYFPQNIRLCERAAGSKVNGGGVAANGIHYLFVYASQFIRRIDVSFLSNSTTSHNNRHIFDSLLLQIEPTNVHEYILLKHIFSAIEYFSTRKRNIYASLSFSFPPLVRLRRFHSHIDADAQPLWLCGVGIIFFHFCIFSATQREFY